MNNLIEYPKIIASYRGDRVVAVWKRWGGTGPREALTQDKLQTVLDGEDVCYEPTCPPQYRTELWVAVEYYDRWLGRNSFRQFPVEYVNVCTKKMIFRIRWT